MVTFTMLSVIFVVLLNSPFSTGSPGSRVDDGPFFWLFTRTNPVNLQFLEPGNLTLLDQSNFNKNLPTKIYSHGFVGSPDAQGWGLRDGYLRNEDCNFIAVDWSILAQGGYEPVATVNVPIVGSTTGSLIDFLVDQGAALDSFHLMGFSMGAHVVGIAGSSVTKGKLTRITGLDPAINVFGTLNESARLDIGDADLVDIIHTSPTSTIDPIGHVDFYPNGGVQQPGCPVPDNYSNCCNHCRAVYVMAESITTTVGFRSVQCTSYDDFENGTCDDNITALMGNPVPTTTRGSFYLTTNGEPPYALG